MARKVLSTSDAAAVEELLLAETGPAVMLSESDCCELLAAALDRGNVSLALSIHAAMRSARRTGATKLSFDGAFLWPAATMLTTSQLVLGLCKQVRSSNHDVGDQCDIGARVCQDSSDKAAPNHTSMTSVHSSSA